MSLLQILPYACTARCVGIVESEIRTQREYPGSQSLHMPTLRQKTVPSQTKKIFISLVFSKTITPLQKQQEVCYKHTNDLGFREIPTILNKIDVSHKF